jgi:hypothetical protein
MLDVSKSIRKLEDGTIVVPIIPQMSSASILLLFQAIVVSIIPQMSRLGQLPLAWRGRRKHHIGRTQRSYTSIRTRTNLTGSDKRTPRGPDLFRYEVCA